MSTTTTRLPATTRSPLPALIAGGLLAGSLDMVFATTFWAVQGVAPLRIPQSVASGVLGSQAFQGGVPTALLGLVLHFAIAFAMMLAYHLAGRRLPWLVLRPVAGGMAYGLLLYLVMSYVVVPLSAARAAPFALDWWLAGSLFSHCILVGIPIALTARRIARREQRPG